MPVRFQSSVTANDDDMFAFVVFGMPAVLHDSRIHRIPNRRGLPCTPMASTTVWAVIESPCLSVISKLPFDQQLGHFGIEFEIGTAIRYRPARCRTASRLLASNCSGLRKGRTRGSSMTCFPFWYGKCIGNVGLGFEHMAKHRAQLHGRRH